MKFTRLLTMLAVGAVGVLLIRYFTQPAPAAGTSAPEASPSPYVPLVENVLHDHQGEDSPIVHAFEQALEEERRHEEQLAHDIGVKA